MKSTLRKAAALKMVVVLLTPVSLGARFGCGPERVHREHAKAVPKEFEHLARRIDFSFRTDQPLSKEQAEQDLDELEWLLENRYSYLKLKGLRYKAALDAIRTSVSNGTTRGALALQIQKLIALFGDAHSRVSNPRLDLMCPGALPFIIGECKGGLVAVKSDRKGLLDEQHPFVQSIDDHPLGVWLVPPGSIVPKGSPQFVRRRKTRELRRINYLRTELGRDRANVVRVGLVSADGRSRRSLELPLAQTHPRDPGWVRRETQVLPENIGYLRIPKWMSDDPVFLEGLVKSMAKFEKTQGLIIDIRGIGGGSRAPLRVLFPFFMTSDDPPQVLNVAAYRLGHRKDILDARWLYPADWEGWSLAERTAIRQLSKTFQPEWRPPADEFSKWHYFVIGRCRKAGYYHYARPVIILMETRNSSASDIFLGAFKGWRNVTLMGTPSTGTSGRYQTYRLHHSRIKLSLSSMASFRPTGGLYDGNGIHPDVLIWPMPTDFIGKTDSILDRAIKRLQGQ